MKFIDFFSGSLKKYLFLSFFLFAFFSCKDDPVTPPEDIPKKDTITISIGDVTHRSVNINIKTTLNNPSRKIKLFRSEAENSFLITEYPISVTDTTIVDDNNGVGLSINTNYTWFAVSADSLGTIKDSSNKVQTTTLDTTSHNYTWEEITLGEWQSFLYDIWGLDDNNVWAVGIVKQNGKDYGLLYWNGTTWKPDTSVGGLSIFGFSPNDIWIVGGAVHHFNGNNWEQKDFKVINNSIIVLDSNLYNNLPYLSIWGSGSNNLYFGSEKGKIVQWDGSKGRDVGIIDGHSFYDIYGFNGSDIYAVAHKPLSDLTDKLYHFNGISWRIIKEGALASIGDYLQKPLYSVYGKNSKDLFLAGRRIYRRINEVWKTEDIVLQDLIVKIRGSNTNNIVAMGNSGKIYHYNGISWKDISPPYQDLFLVGLFLTNNKIFCVGGNASFAKIIIGTKN